MSALAEYRTARNLSQRELAKILGTSQSIVCRIERGDIRPGLDLAFKIERVTGGAVQAASWAADCDAPNDGAAA